MKMDETTVRPMKASDIESVLKIELETALSPWSYIGYQDEINRHDSLALVAEDQNEIIGFGIARLIISAAEAEILNIGVKPGFQDQGIGTKIIREILRWLRRNEIERVWLEVRESNLKARKFYRQCGFEIVGKRKNFYNNPLEDGLLMRMVL